jgi:hypothetical protein
MGNSRWKARRLARPVAVGEQRLDKVSALGEQEWRRQERQNTGRRYEEL